MFACEALRLPLWIRMKKKRLSSKAKQKKLIPSVEYLNDILSEDEKALFVKTTLEYWILCHQCENSSHSETAYAFLSHLRDEKKEACYSMLPERYRDKSIDDLLWEVIAIHELKRAVDLQGNQKKTRKFEASLERFLPKFEKEFIEQIELQSKSGFAIYADYGKVVRHSYQEKFGLQKHVLIHMPFIDLLYDSHTTLRRAENHELAVKLAKLIKNLMPWDTKITSYRIFQAARSENYQECIKQSVELMSYELREESLAELYGILALSIHKYDKDLALACIIKSLSIEFEDMNLRVYETLVSETKKCYLLDEKEIKAKFEEYGIPYSLDEQLREKVLHTLLKEKEERRQAGEDEEMLNSIYEPYFEGLAYDLGSNKFVELSCFTIRERQYFPALLHKTTLEDKKKNTQQEIEEFKRVVKESRSLLDEINDAVDNIKNKQSINFDVLEPQDLGEEELQDSDELELQNLIDKKNSIYQEIREKYAANDEFAQDVVLFLQLLEGDKDVFPLAADDFREVLYGFEDLSEEEIISKLRALYKKVKNALDSHLYNRRYFSINTFSGPFAGIFFNKEHNSGDKNHKVIFIISDEITDGIEYLLSDMQEYELQEELIDLCYTLLRISKTYFEPWLILADYKFREGDIEGAIAYALAAWPYVKNLVEANNYFSLLKTCFANTKPELSEALEYFSNTCLPRFHARLCEDTDDFEELERSLAYEKILIENHIPYIHVLDEHEVKIYEFGSLEDMKAYYSLVGDLEALRNLRKLENLYSLIDKQLPETAENK